MCPEGPGADWLETRLSRRRVLRGALAGGGLLAAGGVLAACGDSGDGTTSTAATSAPATTAAPAETTSAAAPGTTEAAATTAAETAAETTAAETTAATTAAAAGPGVKGGTIRYSVESPPSGFDPAKWWNQLSWDGSLLVNETLLELKQDGSIAPRLLASMPEVDADGTLYTFKLREGVTFSDGTPLTADDVKFSLERLLTPATGSEGASLYTSLPIPGLKDLLDEKSTTLPGIVVVDPTTFTIALEEPRSVFLYVLGLPFAAILPQKYVQEIGSDKFNFAPLGTGPYAIKDVEQSKHITWERNPSYWAADQRGWADTIEWEVGVAPDLAVLRVQRGEIDLMAEPVPAELIAQLQGDASAEDLLEIGVANNVYYVTLSLKQKELADLKVRQAIAHAIDKERFVRAIKGLGEVANGGLFAPASPYFQDGIGYPYDPERAKALLAEAGYADGFSVTFWSANWAPYKEMAQTVKQDLDAIGIKVDAKVLIREQYLAEVVKNPAGLTNNEWELPYPHGSYVMDGAFTQAALDAGCCNFSNLQSPEFDALAAEANSTTDEARLVELYKQMDTMVVKDLALWVPMIYPKFPKIHSARLKGYSVPATPSASVNYLADYWIEEA